MSLRVWLPLNGTLDNQGLDQVTVINNGVTVDNNGKIGKCYSFGASSYLKVPLPRLSEYSTTTFSMCLWVKVPSPTSGNKQLLHIGKGSGWVNNRFTILYQGSTTVSRIVTSISDGSSYGAYSCYADIPIDTWIYIASVFDNRKLKLYINGELKNTYNTTCDLSFNSIEALGIGGAPNGAELLKSGYINDVRIYDHALSPFEVKQISQGLILHYPLNRNGWGQENLMLRTYRADGSNVNKIYGWQANGYGNPEIVIKDGKQCIHLQANCSNKTTPSIVSASKLLLENGTEYTVSCDLMYDKEIKVTNNTPVHYHNGSTDNADPFNLTNVNNGKGFTWKSIKPTAGTIIPANTWQHYEMHLIALATPNDSSLPYSTYRAFIYGSVRTVSETTTVNMWLKNWKIEKGSKATPWCPNSADELATTLGLNDNIQYDTSGYNNNGIKTGNFQYDSNTPKYNVSAIFNGVDNCIQIGNLYSIFSNPFSINLWFKKEVIGSKKYETLIGGASGFEMDTRSGASQTLSLYMASTRGGNAYSPFEFNNWYMVTMVNNGTHELYYINGILTKTIEKKNMSNSNYYIGAWNTPTQQNFKGNMSDIRIYCTALSAEDVLSLYNNSAYIDNQGNIYGAIYEEV